MALAPGTRFGPYEIVAPIGAGGMGEVYRARDRKLERMVAIKVLPAGFSEDPDRISRFEREARVLAALNHRHIAAIYGFEEAGPSAGSGPTGGRALVLEFIDGATLAERLSREALPVSESLSIACQIAEALDAAHERGIVHRDLKPANVKITPDGTVKVLDFGLAKTIDRPTEAATVWESPTETAATRTGVILGTMEYMSPEQTRGQAVDKRTDIWAFGCVLYEMLAGRPAFVGATHSDTIAAVLEREPDWTALPGAVAGKLRRLLQRCLEKDLKRRARDIGDVLMELEELLAPGRDVATTVGGDMGRPRGLWWMATAAALVTVGSVGTLLWVLLKGGDSSPLAVTRTTVTLPVNQELDISASAAPLALSPDGRLLAYVAYAEGSAQLYLRNLDAFEAKPMAGTEGARYPFFSPDGASVAFFADDKLKRVSIRGGSPVPICDTPVLGRGGTWGADGTIVFDPGASGLMRVSAGGGTPQRVASQDADRDRSNLSWPQFLPDGRSLLVTVGPGVSAEGQDALAVLSLDSGKWKDIGPGSQVQYLPPGYLVFHAPHVREGEIQAAAFDIERLAIRGAPVSVLDGVFRSENGGGAYFALAQTGTLVFTPGGYARTLVRVDRSGRRTPLSDDRRGFRTPRISPNGRQVAVVIDPRPSEVWVYDLGRRSSIPLATEGHNLGLAWTPNGQRVTYSSNGDLYWRSADGSSAAEPLLARDRFQYADAWSRDGQFLLFSDAHPTNRWDIWVLPVNGDPRPLLATSAHEVDPTLSPDARWLAYESDESGRREVYVRPFPDVDRGKWAVSTAGGRTPVWSRSGRELFYSSGSSVMAVPVEVRGAAFVAGAPVRLFSGPFETGSPGLDIAPDGTFFVMVEADPNAKPTQINVVLNWVAEAKRVVPTN